MLLRIKKFAKLSYIHHGKAYFNTENLPKITFPQKMIANLDRSKDRRRKLNKPVVKPVKSYDDYVIISCKRKEFNHHRGQFYSEFEPKKLASYGWKHYKSKGDHFTINRFGTIPAFRDTADRPVNFDGLGLHRYILGVLSEMKITEPTLIQHQGIPVILEGSNTLCTAETGSGKTLAYLIPVVQSVMHFKARYQIHAGHNRPIAVIIAPSRELVEQITSIAKSFGETCNINVASLIGGQGSLGTPARDTVDILVSTPGKLLKAIKSDFYDISRCQVIVLDETDTLLDDSFCGTIRYIMNNTQIQTTKPSRPGIREGTQLVLVGATLPRGLDAIFGDIVPSENMVKVSTPYLHKIMPHISQKFSRLGSDDKAESILKIAKANYNAKIPTIIFCNKTKTSFWLANFLKNNNVPHQLINGQLDEQERNGRFKTFQDGDCDILLATDVGSRGLDTTRVQHVINYEFPTFMSDYIHRAGRVGRVGTSGGHVINFITHPWDVELVWQIEIAVRKVMDLHNVNANIKRKLTSLAEKKGLLDETG